MEHRNSFTFYFSFWEAVEKLPPRSQHHVLRAIVLYSLYGEESEPLNNAAKSVFMAIKPNIDASRRKAASGAIGGSRPKPNRNRAESNPQANRKQTESKIEKEDEIEDKIENERYYGARAEASGYAREDAFSGFWESYPQKRDREDAWNAWKKLSPDEETVRSIREGLDIWKNSAQWQEDEGRFVPSPARWLRLRRWEYPPRNQAIPNGASGELGKAELEAIRRLLADPE